MLLPYGEYFNDYVNMDLGVFEGVEFNEMVNKGRRVCRFCAGGVGLWKSDMPGSLAIGAKWFPTPLLPATTPCHLGTTQLSV